MQATILRRLPALLACVGAVLGLNLPRVRASSAAVPVGHQVTISVTADGTQPFTYQWFKNGALIVGATNATYVISSMQTSDAADYTVAVSNSAGSTISDTAALTLSGTPPPPNDTFDNAAVITGITANRTGTNVGASKQPGEPDIAGNAGGASVWWQWKAPMTGVATVDTIGSNFDTLLGVFTGSTVSTLTTVASDDDSGGNGTSKLTFNATAGVTYWIAVDGKNGATGSILLALSEAQSPATPANDNFSAATAISGVASSVSGSNVNATTETGEPNIAGYPAGASVWWKWTAPITGVAAIDTIGSNFDTLLGVYTGSSVSTLSTVASDDDSGGGGTSKVTFTAAAGTTYWIAVDGKNGATGSITLNLAEHPVNDPFAAASAISGTAAQATGTNVGATKESGEPDPTGNVGGASVWWTWTAPMTGVATIDTIGSNFDTLLGVYTGSSVSGLTTIASDDDSGGGGTSKLTFIATANTTYAILVDGKNGVTGSISLQLTEAASVPPPANDAFANATPLSGVYVQATASNVGATKEAGEPNIAGNTGGASVWWTWTAPVTGTTIVATVGSNFDTLLGVYTGSSVGALTTVASDDDSGGGGTSKLTFNAVAGTTYMIAVDGKNGATGSISLSVMDHPANDTFAGATTITGTSAQLSGTNVGASKEPGEPDIAGNPGGASVWWNWTAPADAFVAVNTIGSSFDTLLGVYTGSSVSALTPVASDDNSGGNGASALTFHATAGTTYRIAVDGKGGVSGTIALSLTTAASPYLVPEATGSIFGSADGSALNAKFNQPGGVVSDSVGNVYVADTYNSTVRKITPDGVVSTLAGSAGNTGSSDGTGSTARFDNPHGIAIDLFSGNLYVADTGNDTIRMITPSGVVTTFAGSPGQTGSADGTGSAARFDHPEGVAVDYLGNLYVADTGNDTIRMITPAGVVTTLAGSPGQLGSADGTGSAARFANPYGVAIDQLGTVYVADTANSTIRRITPAGVVTTLAGVPGVTGTSDGTGSAARFDHPQSLATDSSGNILVDDTQNSTIRKVTPAGVVTTLAGSGGVIGTTDGTGASARFDQPQGIAVNSYDTIYVADTLNSTIRKVSTAGVTTTLTGSGANNTTQVNTLPMTLTSVAVDPSGNIFVTDSAASTVDKITTDQVTHLFAGSSYAMGSQDGVGSSASFRAPNGLALDGSGNLYVADTSNSTIRKITSNGTVTTLAGSALAYGSADGTGSAARFSLPMGVAVDGQGNVYVADAQSATIRKITPAGVVTTLAGEPGVWGSSDGNGSSALFNYPCGVAVDASGNVYVADTGNDTIRKISPAGDVTTLAGTPGLAGSADGVGSSGLFDLPYGLAVDSAGTVYVADTGNSTIRKIAPDGTVTTLAGSAGQSGLRDGTGTSAWFNQPRGVTLDGSGNLYVADTGNNVIREITPDGTVTTVPVSKALTSTSQSVPGTSSSTTSSGGSTSSGSSIGSGGAGTSTSSGGGGSGGGIIPPWFAAALLLLGLARYFASKRTRRA